MLSERAVTKAAQPLYGAVILGLGSRDQAQNGRLARPITTDQTDVFSGIDLKSDAAQHLLRAVRFGYVCEAKQHSGRVREQESGRARERESERAGERENFIAFSPAHSLPRSLALPLPRSLALSSSSPRRSAQD